MTTKAYLTLIEVLSFSYLTKGFSPLSHHGLHKTSSIGPTGKNLDILMDFSDKDNIICFVE